MADARVDEWLTLGLITLGALALRLLHLTRYELWVDEAATWWFAQLTASGQIAQQIALEPTPPVYYGMIGLLMRLFGDSDLVLRLPSAIFGAAAIPAVYLLGRELFNRRTGTIAALILAVHPLHLFYSREARVYPLLLLLTVLVLLTLWRALGSNDWRRYVPFGITLALACYSHFNGVFLGLATVVAILVLGRTTRARLLALGAAALAGAMFLPYMVMALPSLKQSGAAWYIDAMYRNLPEEKNPARVLELQFLGADYHIYLRQLDVPPTPTTLRWTAISAQLLLLAVALLLGLRGDKRRQLGLLLFGWLLPILVPWAITHGLRAISQSGRHDFFALGSLVVLLAAGLDQLLSGAGSRANLRRVAAVAAVAAMLAGAGHRLYWLHGLRPAQRFRDTGKWIARNSDGDDQVIAMGVRRLITERYTRLNEGRVGFRSFPPGTDSHPGWSDDPTLILDEPALARDGLAMATELTRKAATPEGPRRLLMLVRGYEPRNGEIPLPWKVDRHLLSALRDAGWTVQETPDARRFQVSVMLPPGATEGDRR
jgi:hypothetical protein